MAEGARTHLLSGRARDELGALRLCALLQQADLLLRDAHDADLLHLDDAVDELPHCTGCHGESVTTARPPLPPTSFPPPPRLAAASRAG